MLENYGNVASLGFPLLKPAVISQLEGGVDIQTDNDLTKEMYERKENVSFELQRDFSQETDFSEASLLEKQQEVYSAGNIKKEKSSTIDGTVKDETSPVEECFF
ncbi:ZNF23 isoform 6, partial [Pongo abelii]